MLIMFQLRLAASIERQAEEGEGEEGEAAKERVGLAPGTFLPLFSQRSIRRNFRCAKLRLLWLPSGAQTFAYVKLRWQKLRRCDTLDWTGLDR